MIKLKETFSQFYRFVLVGILNTAIDLGIVNGLIFITGISAGWEFSAFKATSFSIAVVNSYFWNKFWTFKKKTGGNVTEFGEFFIVSAAGLGVNVGIASLIVNVVDPILGISPQLWANVGSVVAIGFSVIWNFIFYKFVVFKKQLKPKDVQTTNNAQSA